MTKTATKTKTTTKTKNITVHSDEIVTIHSDDLYKIAKTMEGLFKKMNDLDIKISSRDIDAFDTLKSILIYNEIVSGPSYPLTLPKKV